VVALRVGFAGVLSAGALVALVVLVVADIAALDFAPGFFAGGDFAAPDFAAAVFEPEEAPLVGAVFVGVAVVFPDEVGFGVVAADFAAGLAVTLVPLFAVVLAVDPRLFPADAAIAGLWLL
jgi:hypothetical protein